MNLRVTRETTCRLLIILFTTTVTSNGRLLSVKRHSSPLLRLMGSSFPSKNHTSGNGLSSANKFLAPSPDQFAQTPWNYGETLNSHNGRRCPGPLKYYEELGCTLRFAKPEDKCPQSAYCKILKDWPTDKCRLNGKDYDVYEHPRPEDANPCDVECFCSDEVGGASFVCLSQCSSPSIRPGCYERRNATDCCSSHEVCPKSEEERPTCLVDGKTYKDGEHFQPANESAKSCYCGPGYTAGENIAPFCYERKTSTSLLLRHTSDIRSNCAPVYEDNQAPEEDYIYAYRCPNQGDTVISPPTKPVSSDNPDLKCVLGDLRMDIGDELAENPSSVSACVKCVCEVPPIPTCRRTPNKECDYFSRYV